MNSDWRAAYWRDQRFPAGMDGRTFVRGRRNERPDLQSAVRHLRKVEHPTEKEVKMIIRLHRVEY